MKDISTIAASSPRVRLRSRLASWAISAVIAVMACAIAAPALAAEHWGSFKYDGCKTSGSTHFKIYSSVLWGIPFGKSWEVACAKMPARVHGVYFSHPTACQKASVVDAVSVTGAVLSAGGLVYPPAKVAGAIVGGSAFILKATGAGALNMWGVFYIQAPHC
jgi:hypothetical protein